VTGFVLGFAAVSCSEPEGTPAPYFLPRHPDAESASLGLGEGVLEARGKCLYVGDHLVIWPDGYFVTESDGRPVIEGDGWRIAPGDRIEFGGGSYDQISDLPNGRDEAASVPCSGPYNWVSEIHNVMPSQD
jgi:hypothetical protein